MRPRALLFVLALLVAATAAAGPSATDALVDRAIAAFGGKERIEGLRTLMAGSRFKRKTDAGSDEGVLAEFYAFPDRARREYKGRRVAVMGTDGESAWAVKAMQTVPERRDRFVVPLRLRQLGRLLLDVKEGRARAESVPGAPAGQRRLLLTLEDGEMIQLDVEEESGRVRRYAGEAHEGDATLVLVVEIDAWRQEAGFWLPGSLRARRGGELVEEIELQHARVNGPMSPGFFRAPWDIVGRPPRKL